MEETIRQLEGFVRQRFGDLVTPEELALLRQPEGLEKLKRLLAERCRQSRCRAAR